MRRMCLGILLVSAALLIFPGGEIEAQTTAEPNPAPPVATTPGTTPAPASAATNAPKQKPAKGKKGDGNAPPPCTGDELPLVSLAGTDATALAKMLNSLFPDFAVTVAGDKNTGPYSLCIASREKNKKPDGCSKIGSSSRHRCELDAIFREADTDAFVGSGFNSNFVVPLHNLTAAVMAQALHYPTPDFELRNPADNYLMLVPLAGATAQDSGKNDGLAKQAASIKHDLQLLDELYGSALSDTQLFKDMVAALQSCGSCNPADVTFEKAERLAEQWLVQHTVRLSFLDPRDAALALSSLPTGWIFQVRSFGRAVTILPAATPSLRTYGAYLAADAIERDVIYQRRLAELKASSQAGNQDGGEGKPSSPGNVITTHTTTTTTQPAPQSKPAAAPVTTVVDSVTTTSQSAASQSPNAAPSSNQPAGGDKTGNSAAPDPTSTSNNSGTDKTGTDSVSTNGGTKSGNTTLKTSAPAKPSGGGGQPSATKPALSQQAMHLDNVVRLYHLRQAKQIADAINTASTDAKHLVEALDDNGNNDLLLILPSASGGDDQSTPIRRAIALLDLPRPQLSLQVWSYQISAEEPSDYSVNKRGASSVQKAFELLRSTVNGSNGIMTRSLQSGFGQLLDEAAEAKGRSDSIFDPTFEAYLTARYDNCVELDSYCLGYLDALAIPTGKDRAANASLSRLLLYLIAVSDSDAADVARDVIDAMQPENCPAGSTKGDDSNPRLCFIHFGEQLTAALQPRNLHILRAALLDFLFEYKWTNVYRNDFVPYDLQRTAHLLDSLLGPIIEAFNEDLDNYVILQLDSLEKKMTHAVEGETSYDKAGLSTLGMVQVATLSGSQASVDAKVSNYFDITPPMSLNDILNSGNQQNIASNLKNILEPKEILILQALANIGSQPRITAELTKEAKLTVTPTTLDTASGAQLDVDFDVSEPSPPATANQKTSTKDLLDRVADHHVATHVRVESLKLFQVSAFTMELTHPQRGVPIPVIGWAWQGVFGTTPGLDRLFVYPRGPKTIDNRSVAIVRAVVVPTAMDIGLGLPFMADRIYDPVSDATDPIFSVAQSGGRIRPFHKELMSCILNGNSDCHQVKLSSMREDLRDPTSP